MKTIIMKTFAAGIVATALLFTSCTKDGATGATGPQGPAGNANVQTFNFTANPWTLSSSTTYWYYDYPLTVPTNAAVMVYYTSSTLNSGSAANLSLPITLSGNQIYFKYNSTTLEMGVNSVAGTVGVSNPGPLNFQVVVIPPAARLANPNVNLHNFDEVKAAYHLK